MPRQGGGHLTIASGGAAREGEDGEATVELAKRDPRGQSWKCGAADNVDRDQIGVHVSVLQLSPPNFLYLRPNSNYDHLYLPHLSSLRVSRPICTAAAWAACPAGHREGCAPIARWPASPRRLCFRPDRHHRAHLQLPPSRPAGVGLLCRQPRLPRRRQHQPRAGSYLSPVPPSSPRCRSNRKRGAPLLIFVSPADLEFPVDGVVISGHSLAMDESSMTGQSKIVHKDQKAPILMSGCKVADSYGSMLARTTW